MKRFLSFYIIFTILVSTVALFNLEALASNNQKNLVYVVNVKGEINPGMYYYVKKAVEKAESEGADAVLFEIDTFGGRVDSAVDISNIIVSSSIPTIAFVNKKAESAGVLISISCDKIYMTQGSTIGSAETIPNTEKNISYWTSQLKTVAEQKGRNPHIVAAMADKSIEIKGLIEKGKLLNLTNNKAKEIKFIDGISKTRKNIYDDLKMPMTKEKVLENSVFEKIINIITSSYIAPMLLSLGFVGMIVELITPGFGVGGIISLLGFSLFFGGSVLGGSSSSFVLLLFLLGMIFLILEAMAPGFGIFGIGGIVSIVLSIIMASNSVLQAFIYIVLAFIVTIVTVIFALRKLPRRKISKTLFLNTELNKQEGFISSKENDEYINKEGISASDLRPSGKIEIDGVILDAISQNTFIEKGKLIKVIKVEGSKIIVKEKRED